MAYKLTKEMLDRLNRTSLREPFQLPGLTQTVAGRQEYTPNIPTREEIYGVYTARTPEIAKNEARQEAIKNALPKLSEENIENAVLSMIPIGGAVGRVKLVPYLDDALNLLKANKIVVNNADDAVRLISEYDDLIKAYPDEAAKLGYPMIKSALEIAKKGLSAVTKEAVKKNWFGRNWKWVIPTAAVIGPGGVYAGIKGYLGLQKNLMGIDSKADSTKVNPVTNFRDMAIEDIAIINAYDLARVKAGLKPTETAEQKAWVIDQYRKGLNPSPFQVFKESQSTPNPANPSGYKQPTTQQTTTHQTTTQDDIDVLDEW